MAEGMSLSQIDLVWVKFCVKGWIQDQNSRWLPSSSELEWMSEVFSVQMVGTNLGKCEWVWEEKLRWLNPRCGIQVGRIQDGCHHQVRWEWMSLSQIELCWVRVRLEWEHFWVNLRDDNKVSESKMCRMVESKIAEYQYAVIIKLSQNEWVKVFYVLMVGTNLGKCEWVWE